MQAGGDSVSEVVECEVVEVLEGEVTEGEVSLVFIIGLVFAGLVKFEFATFA